MLKKYYVKINKIVEIEHEIQAENKEELETILKNYASNFDKFDENKTTKFVFDIIDEENNYQKIQISNSNIEIKFSAKKKTMS